MLIEKKCIAYYLSPLLYIFMITLFPQTIYPTSNIDIPLTDLQKKVVNFQVSKNLRNKTYSDERIINNKTYMAVFKMDKLKNISFMNEYMIIPSARRKESYAYFFLAGYMDTDVLEDLINQNTCFAMQFLSSPKDMYNSFRYRLFVAPNQIFCKYHLTTVIDDKF